MRKRIPSKPNLGATASTHGSILELDRFSEASVQQWNDLSQDLDELSASLYFGVEPERRRYRQELLEALRSAAPVPQEFNLWVRAVSYRYSLSPLSAAGSLQDIGGRFNAGTELDDQPLSAWPALYLAEDFETAFREKYQLPSDHLQQGLSAQDLALETGGSFASVTVRGKLTKVFDLTSPASLGPVAGVFRRIAMPAKATKLKKKLKIPSRDFYMVKTPQQVFDAVLKYNWRVQPRQFGLPSSSQTLAELIRAADFEAILYQSSKGPGKCLAVFPDMLLDTSFIELVDKPPPEVKHSRLDSTTGTELCGWDSVAHQLRRR